MCGQTLSVKLAGSDDFQFTLFDALNAGAQVGTLVNANGVPIANGIFTLALDFGDQFMDLPQRQWRRRGSAISRWL